METNDFNLLSITNSISVLTVLVSLEAGPLSMQANCTDYSVIRFVPLELFFDKVCRMQFLTCEKSSVQAGSLCDLYL